MIPKRYEEANIDEVPVDIVEKFNEMRDTRKGIYIHGDVGTGKTFVAYSLYQEWQELRNEEKKERDKKNTNKKEDGVPASEADSEIIVRPRGEFWNMTRLLYELRKEIRKPVDDSLSEDLIVRKNLLFIDDLGAEKVTDWVEEVIYLIINSRYENNYPIIITSNYPLSGIAERVGDRVASRIKEMCHIIKLDGEDRRLTK